LVRHRRGDADRDQREVPPRPSRGGARRRRPRSGRLVDRCRRRFRALALDAAELTSPSAHVGSAGTFDPSATARVRSPGGPAELPLASTCLEPITAHLESRAGRSPSGPIVARTESLGDVRLGIVSVKTLDERTRDTIMAAAAAGLDHVGSIDHVCFRGGEGIDGLITAAALAGIHPNIGRYVGVYQLPLRHPVLVARQLSTLAHFAPGRLTFGIGVAGEDAHEFENCGVDVHTRGRRTDESLALLRRLLTG